MENCVIIRNGSLIDGTGGALIPKGAVLVRGNRIETAGPEHRVKVPKENILEIDAQGGAILPGFIDCHVHLMLGKFDIVKMVTEPFSYRFYAGLRRFRDTLDAGITTVRDAGGMDLGMKKAIDDGTVYGPRSKISINALSITGGHNDLMLPSGISAASAEYPGMPSPICDGVPEIRKRVREMLRAGADIIKICSTGGILSPADRPEFCQFSPEELRAIVQEAAFHGGKKVMSHAEGEEGIRQAVKAGIYSIEHGCRLTDDILALMKEKGTWLIPTLTSISSVLEDPDYLKKLPEEMLRQTEEIVEAHRESVVKAYKNGIRIAMGTDSGVMEHGQNLRELHSMCRIGMTPMESIMASTKYAAECLEWDQNLGTLEPGKLADIVISSVNPLDDIPSLSSRDTIKVVMKDGKIMKDIRL